MPTGNVVRGVETSQGAIAPRVKAFLTDAPTAIPRLRTQNRSSRLPPSAEPERSACLTCPDFGHVLDPAGAIPYRSWPAKELHWPPRHHVSAEGLPTAMPPIDVTIVCGARPQLLRRTLDSFGARVFPHFEIARVFANIDRFQGGEAEVDACEVLLVERFGSVNVRKPETPSFTDAVRWLWGSVVAGHALHLEDDWLAHHPIWPEMIFRHFDDRTRQVSLNTREKHWPYRHPYHCRVERRVVFGIKIGRRFLDDQPVFTTSPSFVERDFAHGVARLLDDRFDPEKQMNHDADTPLRAFTRRFRNRLMGCRNGYPIEDIGRAYRDATGLEKRYVAGAPVWVSPDA